MDSRTNSPTDASAGMPEQIYAAKKDGKDAGFWSVYEQPQGRAASKRSRGRTAYIRADLSAHAVCAGYGGLTDGEALDGFTDDLIQDCIGVIELNDKDQEICECIKDPCLTALKFYLKHRLAILAKRTSAAQQEPVAPICAEISEMYRRTPSPDNDTELYEDGWNDCLNAVLKKYKPFAPPAADTKAAIPDAPVAGTGSDVEPVARVDVVPGRMYCAKCKFQLSRNVIYAQTGNIGPGTGETEPCPNGCGPLWPLTWKMLAMELDERLQQELAEPTVAAPKAEHDRAKIDLPGDRAEALTLTGFLAGVIRCGEPYTPEVDKALETIRRALRAAPARTEQESRDAFEAYCRTNQVSIGPLAKSCYEIVWQAAVAWATRGAVAPIEQ